MTVMLLEWTFTSVFLILVVLALRAALGKRMNAGLRYGLWAVVLLRLLVPVQLFTAPIAGTWVMTEKRTERSVTQWAAPTAPAEETVGLPPADMTPGTVPSVPEAPILPDPPEPPAVPDLTKAAGWLGWVWLAGTAAVALVLLLSNLWFYWKLRRERLPLEAVNCPLRVYVVTGLPSPCLFGLVRPMVYVPPEAVADPAMLRHVLAHEYTHYCHGDHVWSLLRCAALAVHWWNPLVWLAAVCSRRDGELACDEGALKRLGDGERAGYGNTLLALVTAKPRPEDLFRCATTMAGDKKSLKERISRIACAPKRVMWAVVVAVLVTALACVCAFGQAEPEPSEDGDGYATTYAMSGNGVVLVQGLGDAYVEWRGPDTSPSRGWLHFNGDVAFCCPRLAGREADGSALWTDESRTAVGVVMNVSDERVESGTATGVYIYFKVELDSRRVLERTFESEQGGETLELTDQEMLDMARALAKLLTEAEDFYNSVPLSSQPAPAQTAAPDGALQADLNRNGVPEELRVVSIDGGAGQRLEVWENDKLVFSEEGFSAHAGWTSLFLRRGVNGDYLLRYHPTMYGGVCDYSYQLFTLENDQETVVLENSLEFDINFQPWLHQSFDPEAIANYVGDVNSLLTHSVQLLNTDKNLLGTFEKNGQLYDDLWFMDTMEGDFARDPSKSLLENLRAYQKAMEDLWDNPWDDPWGLCLTTSLATPTGVNIAFTQTGGAPTGELKYGSRYWLLREDEGDWVEVPDILDLNENWIWTDEAYIIPMSGQCVQEVNWSWLYGELPPGHYCICKEVTDWRAPGDFDEQTYYAQFFVD